MGERKYQNIPHWGCISLQFLFVFGFCSLLRLENSNATRFLVPCINSHLQLEASHVTSKELKTFDFTETRIKIQRKFPFSTPQYKIAFVSINFLSPFCKAKAAIAHAPSTKAGNTCQVSSRRVMASLFGQTITRGFLPPISCRKRDYFDFNIKSASDFAWK